MAASRMSFSYPEEMKNALQKLADKEDRSLSKYIQIILNKHLENVKRNNVQNTRRRVSKNPTPQQTQRRPVTRTGRVRNVNNIDG